VPNFCSIYISSDAEFHGEHDRTSAHLILAQNPYQKLRFLIHDNTFGFFSADFLIVFGYVWEVSVNYAVLPFEIRSSWRNK